MKNATRKTIVLFKHFEDKTTFIIGDFIINGCQTFNIKDIEAVCKQHSVPGHIKQQVIDVHKTKSIDGIYEQPEYYGDLEADIAKVKDGKEIPIENMVDLVELGYLHDELHNSRYVAPRVAIALSGSKHEILHTDKDRRVRMAVAKAGGYHDVLYKDEDWRVRMAVAKAGGYHDVLYKDEDWCVRMAVAKAGGYRDALCNDDDERVRIATKFD